MTTATPETSLPYAVLRALSDGRFHSGEALAQAAGVTRAAIWKAIQSLQQSFGLEIHSVRGRGYRLSQSLELLDRDTIRQHLAEPERLAGLETFLSIDSTNQYLMHADARRLPSPWAVLAEHQSAGRGRRGRTWQSPLAGNLYCSLLWRFNQVATHVAGLSLAVGAVVCRELTQLGIADLGLKWPNDVLCQGKKLCGILIEMSGETHGPSDVVIGVGLNLAMPAASAQQIDQPWIALQQVSTDLPPRNALAARLISAILQALPQFQTQGLQPFLEEWRRLDCYRDQAVLLHLGEQQIRGLARGVDEQGALLVEHQGKLQRYYSGEISLRMP